VGRAFQPAMNKSFRVGTLGSSPHILDSHLSENALVSVVWAVPEHGKSQGGSRNTFR